MDVKLCLWEDSVKMDHKEVGWKDMGWVRILPVAIGFGLLWVQ
jgi:hypothetical protein